MKIIISPAKKMVIDQDAFPVLTQAVMLEQAKILADFLKSRTAKELKEIWEASDRIVAQGQKQLEQLDFERQLTPAIMSYQGIQYQYMAADLLSKEALDFLQEHVRILSGLYGILRPFDGVQPYRLEVKNKVAGFQDGNLYHFWAGQVADELFKDETTIINLASKEYSRMIAPYLTENRKMVTIDFQELKAGKWKTVGVHAKMARGEMTRFICQNQIDSLDGLKDFNDFAFSYNEEESSEDNYVFRTDFDFTRK